MMEAKAMPILLETKTLHSAAFVITHADKMLMVKRRMVTGLCLPVLPLLRGNESFDELKERLGLMYGITYRGSYYENLNDFKLHDYGKDRPTETVYRLFELKAVDDKIISSDNASNIDYLQWVSKSVLCDLLTDPLYVGTISEMSKRLLTNVIK